MIEILLFLILLVLVVKWLPGIATFVVSAILAICALIGALVLLVAFL